MTPVRVGRARRSVLRRAGRRRRASVRRLRTRSPAPAVPSPDARAGAAHVEHRCRRPRPRLRGDRSRRCRTRSRRRARRSPSNATDRTARHRDAAVRGREHEAAGRVERAAAGRHPHGRGFRSCRRSGRWPTRPGRLAAPARDAGTELARRRRHPAAHLRTATSCRRPRARRPRRTASPEATDSRARRTRRRATRFRASRPLHCSRRPPPAAELAEKPTLIAVFAGGVVPTSTSAPSGSTYCGPEIHWPLHRHIAANVVAPGERRGRNRGRTADARLTHADRDAAHELRERTERAGTVVRPRVRRADTSRRRPPLRDQSPPTRPRSPRRCFRRTVAARGRRIRRPRSRPSRSHRPVRPRHRAGAPRRPRVVGTSGRSMRRDSRRCARRRRPTPTHRPSMRRRSRRRPAARTASSDSPNRTRRPRAARSLAAFHDAVAAAPGRRVARHGVAGRVADVRLRRIARFVRVDEAVAANGGNASA